MWFLLRFAFLLWAPLFESSLSLSLGVVTLDPPGNVLAWDSAAEMLLGRSLDTSVGAPFPLLFAPPERDRVQQDTKKEGVTGS